MDYLYEGKWEEIILEPSGDTLPIGSIAQFGGKTAPTNWLFCNGQAVSRETYAELFSVIGTTYGDGDGSTTFNVPDFIGRVPVGLDKEDTDFDTLGETGGEKTHKLTIDEMPEHHHAGIKYSNYNQWLTSETGSNGNTIGLKFNTGGNPLNSVKSNENLQYSTDQRGGSQAHNNMQPYTVTNFIIKAKQSVGLVGAITDNINDINENAVPNTKTVKEYVDKKQTYSTDEIVIGTYLNKPLYRKVINMGNLVNNSSKNVAHNLSNFVIRTINGSATNGSVHIGISGFNDEVYIDKTNVIWSTKANRSSFTAYVVLEYTKITD